MRRHLDHIAYLEKEPDLCQCSWAAIRVKDSQYGAHYLGIREKTVEYWIRKIK